MSGPGRKGDLGGDASHCLLKGGGADSRREETNSRELKNPKHTKENQRWKEGGPNLGRGNTASSKLVKTEKGKQQGLVVIREGGRSARRERGEGSTKGVQKFREW